MDDIMDITRDLVPPRQQADHVILIGDLNVTGPPRSPDGTLSRVGPGGNTCCFTDTKGGGAQVTSQWSFDHIYISAGLRSSRYAIQKPKTGVRTPAGIVTSDHFPVEARIHEVINLV